jgi:hypothetical protein
MFHYVVLHRSHERTESSTVCDSLEAAQRQACIHVLDSLSETDWDPKDQGGQLERVQEVVKHIGEGNYKEALSWAQEIFSDEGLHETLRIETVEASDAKASSSTDIPLWQRYSIFLKAFNDGAGDEDADESEAEDEDEDDGESDASEST